MPIAPSPRRRRLLKLMAGTIAGAGLGGLRPGRTFAAAAPERVDDGVIGLEFDASLRSRVLMGKAGGFEPLTALEPSEVLRLADGRQIDAFAFVEQSRVPVEDAHGRGTRHLLRGRADEAIEKLLTITLYDRLPGFALLTVSYRNLSRETVAIDRWANGAHVLEPAADGAPAYWSFSGASYVDRRDWVQPLYAGFSQRNFMGMNATDYGGGTPVVDVWRRDCGLAVGHVETVPKLVALPITVSAAGARVAVEGSAPQAALAPGESFATVDSFVAVHRGDFFATLEAYRRILAERGIVQAEVPESAYAPVWCGWGYEKDFTVEQVRGTLPKASGLGLVWAVPDDGWQTALGDWYLDRKKFPRGDADMIALVKAIRDVGMKPRLWVAPLAAEPNADLLREHADLLLLDKVGDAQDVTGWNSLYLCPAYPETVRRSRALVRKILLDWGYEGLKIDGQHLNAVAPCYNPAHKHTRPEESVERLPEFWKALAEEARSINPDAVLEFCPCGTAYAAHSVPYMHQAVGSDPLSSWQVRHKGKAIKALMGASTPYAGDHVELSDGGDDFASTVGVGAVVSTKFTWPRYEDADNEFLLTASKEKEWRQWIALYKDKMLPRGRYLGDLYDIGFDKPEAHVVAKDGRLYYAFYAERWDGPLELRGLGSGRYTVIDYWSGARLGTVSASENRLAVSFRKFLLLEATPIA